MILNYKECMKRFGSDYMIKKEIKEGKLFQKERGLYSDEEFCLELELVVAKSPRAVFVRESAYYYYGLTDVIPDYYFLATKRGDTRIKDKEIKQTIGIRENRYDKIFYSEKGNSVVESASFFVDECALIFVIELHIIAI